MEIKNNRSSRNEATNSMMNDYADILITRILDIINENNKHICQIDSAIVESINTDGTVNIYFPPDKDKIFTNISNQTPFTLEVGDNVEIMLKNGLYSNCWIVARHVSPEATYPQVEAQKVSNAVDGLTDKTTTLGEQINILLESINNLTTQVNNLTTQVNNLATNKANIASPTLTGAPRAPTVATASDSSTRIATTAFVQAAISAHST